MSGRLRQIDAIGVVCGFEMGSDGSKRPETNSISDSSMEKAGSDIGLWK